MRFWYPFLPFPRTNLYVHSRFNATHFVPISIQFSGQISVFFSIPRSRNLSFSRNDSRNHTPVAVRAGASLLGRWLLPRVRQHSALSEVSWRSDLRGAANTQKLRRQNFCSRWTSLVELSSGPAAQSRHHLRTVQTTAEGTPFSGSMNTALYDFWYATP